jgi:lysophospholipase L1-like esterase
MKSKKYYRLICLLPVIIICCALASCSKPQLPPLAGDAVILAFGDSLTFGTGADAAESYPAVLEKMINRQVVNYGIPGEVTAEGLRRLPEILDEEKPALMILCHGGNDQLRRLNLDQAEGNIRKMIQLAREKNVAVVLIAVPAPGLTLSPPSLYRKIARQMSVPIEENILSDVLTKNSLKSDLIHPNAAGYRMIAESIAALLRKNGAIDERM